MRGFCVSRFSCMPSPKPGIRSALISESIPLWACAWLISAMSWTKTLGHNTLKTSEEFTAVPKSFNFCLSFFSSYFKLVELSGKWFCSPSEWKLSWEWKNMVVLLEDQSFTFSWWLQRKTGSPESWAVGTAMGNLRPEPLLLSRQGSRPGFMCFGRSSNSQGLSWERHLWCWLEFVDFVSKKERCWGLFYYWLKAARCPTYPFPTQMQVLRLRHHGEPRAAGFLFLFD